jgi:hypothetical protein
MPSKVCSTDSYLFLFKKQAHDIDSFPVTPNQGSQAFSLPVKFIVGLLSIAIVCFPRLNK